MNTISTAEIAAVLSTAPAWAKHCLPVADPRLQEKGATEIAVFLCHALEKQAASQMPSEASDPV
ncbi:DUF6771 family protein [Sphingomonas sp. AP4-R1]|uniref:DUF6771 family protein n=1 Tax=Sphingomonas sp. AP4-R1 TaxID=2735134 RepID=UPI003462B946